MTNSLQPSSNHILMETTSAGGFGGGDFSAGGLPSLSLPIETQTHGPTRMPVDQTRLRVTREPNVMHSSLHRTMDLRPSVCPRRHMPSSNDDINFVRPSSPASRLARYPPKKNIFAGGRTQKNNHYSESSLSSRVAPYYLPPIHIADNTSSSILAEPVAAAGGFHHHPASSSSSLVHLSSLGPSFSRETNRSMSEYLLHCAADQQEKQFATNQVKNNGPVFNTAWPKSWDRQRFSSQADKRPTISIDPRLGDDDDDDDDDDSLDKEKRPTTTNTDSIHHWPPPVDSLKHLVSPHAIRKAEQEEQDEAMGGQPEHPFSAFPSFMSMKHLHEDQIKAYYHRSSKSTSPSSHFSILSPNHATESPSPSSSSIFSPLSAQASVHQSNLADSHHSHHPHPSSLVLENPLQQPRQQPHVKSRERLKRPPNAYLLFNRDMRRKLLEISPKMTVAEISKEIGERWRELSKDQRQPYIDQAAVIKQDHLQNHPDFIYTRRSKAEIAEARKMSKSRKFAEASVKPSGAWVISSSSDDPPGPDQAADDKRQRRRRRQQDPKNGPRDPRGRKKKRHRHPTGPKHPMSGFLFYLSSVRPEIAQRLPGSTVGPISKIIARQWRAMTDQERGPWIEKAEQDKARYAREMQAYMAGLDDQGRVLPRIGAHDDLGSGSVEQQQSSASYPSSCPVYDGIQSISAISAPQTLIPTSTKNVYGSTL